MRMKTILVSGGLALSLTTSGFGQLARTGDTTGFVSARVPETLEPYVRAMGNRIRTSGKEQIALDGTFTDAAGSRPARVTLDLAGYVRLDGVRADGQPILFDGDAARAGGYVLTDADQAVLDAFAVDSIEAMLGQVARGASFRLLGRGFGPDPSKPEQAGGPVFDILEVSGPRPTRGDHPEETRRYYFDNPTGLLMSVRHTDGFRKLETRFAGWAELDGAMYPGQIGFYEDDRPVFVFTTWAAGADPTGDITLFRQP
jgi:hypothetical protein